MINKITNLLVEKQLKHMLPKIQSYMTPETNLDKVFLSLIWLSEKNMLTEDGLKQILSMQQMSKERQTDYLDFNHVVGIIKILEEIQLNCEINLQHVCEKLNKNLAIEYHNKCTLQIDDIRLFVKNLKENFDDNDYQEYVKSGLEWLFAQDTIAMLNKICALNPEAFVTILNSSNKQPQYFIDHKRYYESIATNNGCQHFKINLLLAYIRRDVPLNELNILFYQFLTSTAFSWSIVSDALNTLEFKFNKHSLDSLFHLLHAILKINDQQLLTKENINKIAQFHLRMPAKSFEWASVSKKGKITQPIIDLITSATSKEHTKMIASLLYESIETYYSADNIDAVLNCLLKNKALIMAVLNV